MSTYLTIQQLVEKHPCFTKGGMRYYLFNSKFNGLDDSQAIIRIGRKILIEEEKFFEWINKINNRNYKMEA